MAKMKRLYRSQDDRLIAGVCGGIAEYFAVDPVWVRLIAIVLLFVDGIGLIAYLAAWIIVPSKPKIQKGPDTGRRRMKRGKAL